MFNLKLSPIAGDSDTQISVDGDVLTYNGVGFDFSTILNGDVAEASFPAVGEVTRVNGVIQMGLSFVYDMTTAELEQSTNPEDYVIEIENGDVELPIIRKPLAEPEPEPEPETESFGFQGVLLDDEGEPNV
jgi:hypothetical protein